MSYTITLSELFGDKIPYVCYPNLKVIIEDDQSVFADWKKSTIRFEQKEKHEGNTGRVSRVLYNQICDLNRSLNNRIKELEKELEEARANDSKPYIKISEYQRVLDENAFLKACNDASGSVLKDRNDAVDKLREENKWLRNQNATAEINLKHHENRIKELEKELKEARELNVVGIDNGTDHERNVWTLWELIGSKTHFSPNLTDIKVIFDKDIFLYRDWNNNALKFKIRTDTVKKLEEENKMLQANIHDVQKTNEDLHKQLVIEQSLRRISESTYGLVNGTGKGEPIGITNDPKLAKDYGPHCTERTSGRYPWAESVYWEAFKMAVKSNDPANTFNEVLNKRLGKNNQPSKFGVPKIEKVMFRDPATIVFWKDGTKTVVKAHNEAYDPEKGLAMAIAKKALGNDRGYYKTFQKWSGKFMAFDEMMQIYREGATGGYFGNSAKYDEEMPEDLKDMDIASMHPVMRKKEKEEESVWEKK